MIAFGKVCSSPPLVLRFRFGVEHLERVQSASPGRTTKRGAGNGSGSSGGSPFLR